ncbi:YihY/virulence factor BrkB family protein [Gordonia alkaliphila]|uniref:YihY/virulence factor BrkB family protein n=1 Tax=Gordonia alkaliphila TaxID=1053547 RepID=UPI001FF30932|nr:YihY/virulence factor BrkB family protein [Gordonia alkaliphila]MCK0440234.1 YihY/virulence factor BrkB family protein [Gordonia alkaliphila]
MSVVERLDRFHRRYPKTGFPLAVAYKFFDDQGGYLAALITYYGFVSLFPLLLLFTTILGFLLENNPGLRDQIVSSTMSEIPVIGGQLNDPAALSGGTTAVLIGLIGALYGGLGVAVASQNAMNAVWDVPRNSRPNPIKVRLRGLVLLFTVGLSMVALVAISIVAASFDVTGLGDLFTRVGTFTLALVVFVFAFIFGTARKVGVLDVLPGAVIAAAGWQLLEHFGGYYIEHVIARTEKINGVFAMVLGLIAFIYLAAALVVICLEVNAVRVDKLYPRALLTPFTDNVDLTEGDEKAYRQLAQAQRQKGFETIEVTFDNPRSKP